jgi:hypothetical protein
MAGAIAGGLLSVAPFTRCTHGGRHVSSVMAGIWNATVPVFRLPTAILWIADEHATPPRFCGLAGASSGSLPCSARLMLGNHRAG